MNTTNYLIQLWSEGRTRFTGILEKITPDDLTKRLAPSPNSLGFLIRHIGDVEMLFTKNVFQDVELQVHAKTVIAQKDTGEWTNLEELKQYVSESANVLKRIIESQTEENWAEIITTKEFGTKTKAEALGRIVTHTAYHAGQMAIILKYGAPHSGK